MYTIYNIYISYILNVYATNLLYVKNENVNTFKKFVKKQAY